MPTKSLALERLDVFRGRPLLIGLLYASMLFIGFSNGVRSVCLPLIKAEFQNGYDIQGLMLALSCLAGAIAALVAGIIFEKLGSKKAILIYYAMLALSLWGMCWSLVFGAFVLFYCVNLASSVYFETCKNDVALRAFLKKFAVHISLLSFCVGFGSIAGPKVAGYAINTLGIPFRQFFLSLAVVPLTMFVLALVARFNLPLFEKPKEVTEDEKIGKLTTFSAMKNPLVWLFAFDLAMISNIDKGLEEWSLLYYQELFGVNPLTLGATVMSVFYIAMSVGRFVNGFAMEKIGYFRYYKIAMFVSLGLMLAGFLLGEPGMWVLSLSGGFVAMLWPTQVALMLKSFGRNAASIMAASLAISSLIRAASQLGMGQLNALLGPQWAYRCLIPFMLLLIGAVFATQRALKKYRDWN